jgi:hypothetical protein
MIIHVYGDGSEGFQYEMGDRVVVKRTIHGGWFDIGPTRSEHCIVKGIKQKDLRFPPELDIQYSSDWGLASCYPWMLEPHAETMADANFERHDEEIYSTPRG